MATDHIPTADGTDLIAVPAARHPSQPPPCAVCPKWDGLPGERTPRDGDEDLFASPWFLDVRDAYHEGRALGFADHDPFTREALTVFDEFDRRADRRATSASLVSAMARHLRGT